MFLKAGKKYAKGQAAIDFLSSYGVALVIILVALAIIYNEAVINRTITTSSCTAFSGFSCGFYFINTSGSLQIQLSQAIGSEIVVNGISCSTQVNNTGNKPAFGNIFTTNSPVFYPKGNAPGSGVEIFTGSSHVFNLFCYDGGGQKASSILGDSFFGYIWINYTIPSLNSNATNLVASLATKYSSSAPT